MNLLNDTLSNRPKDPIGQEPVENVQKETPKNGEEKTPKGKPDKGEEADSGEDPKKKDEYQKEAKSSMSEIDELLSKAREKHPVQSKEEPKKDEPKNQDKKPKEKDPKKDEEESSALDFSDEDFEEIQTDPKKFRDYMDKVYQNAYKKASKDFDKKLEEATGKLKEETVKSIPEVFNKTAQRTQAIQSARNKFFEDNPQLKERVPYVRDMINVVSSENPDWQAEQVLEEVGKRAQRDIVATQEAEKREKERKPVFAGAGGHQTAGGGEDRRSRKQRLIDDTFGYNRE